MASVSGKADPVVRRIAAADIAEALGQGLRDFQAVPLYGLAFGALYAAGGIAILLCLTAFGMVYLAYPLAAGFAMIGPFVAIGLYEVSRRREAGQPVSIGGDLGHGADAQRDRLDGLRHAVRVRGLDVPGAALDRAAARAQRLVLQPARFITVVLTTNEGLLFLAIGNAVGAALSLILFSLTVVSFPLLLDRDVDFVTAMITSVRAVVTSPLPMIGWAALIVILLAVSAMPYFLGLVVTLPVLGHTTWHLYRRIIAPLPARQPRPSVSPPSATERSIDARSWRRYGLFRIRTSRPSPSIALTGCSV